MFGASIAVKRAVLRLSWQIANTLFLGCAMWWTSRWQAATVMSSAALSVGIVALFYFLALLLIAWLLYCTSSWFKSRLFIIVGFAVLFVWGSTAYFCWPVDREEGETPSRAVLMAEAPTRLLSCFLSGSLLEKAPNDKAQLHYELFHLLLMLYLGGWAFSIWGRGAMNRLRRRGASGRHLDVFWGVNEQGMLLAQDILAHALFRQVEFNIPEDVFSGDEGEGLTHSLDTMNCLWLPVDLDRLRPTHLKGTAHYFLSDSSAENVRVAAALAAMLPEKVSGEKKTFHVRIDSSADERFFYDWADSVKDKVDVTVVRESEMIARQLLADHSILTSCPGVTVDSDTAHVEGGVRLLLIGCGAVGWDVIERTICESRFSLPDGKELPIACTVIDKDPHVADEFREFAGEAVSAYNVSFLQKDVTGSDFPAWEADRLSDLNRVVLCLPTDDLNIGTLYHIERAMTERRSEDKGVQKEDRIAARIFVKVRNPENHACLADIVRKKATGGDRFFRQVELFGNLERIYRERFFNYDTLVEIAYVLNAYYNPQRWMDVKKDRDEIRDLWARASHEDRWSSLSSAAGEWNALRLLGFVPTKRKGTGADGDLVACQARVAERIDILARNEHFRWNAWHRLHGYRRWDLDHPPVEDEAEKKANKLKAFRRHAAIVDYDDLPSVDRRLAVAIDPAAAAGLPEGCFKNDGSYTLQGKTYPCMQRKDRDFCRAIPANMMNAGYRVRHVRQ